MKKFATILVLLFVLSVSTFAEGEIHTGNRNCPQGQTCFVDGEIPIGNETSTEGQPFDADNGGIIHSDGLMEDSIIGNVFYFLKSIF